VLVDGHGEGGRGVAESLAHDLDRNTRFQEQAGVAVAEVVETDDGQPGAGDQAVEGLAEQVGVDRRALGAGEHEPVVLVLLPEGETFFELALPPGAQDGDGSWVEVDRPAARAGLDIRDLEGVGDGDDRLVNREAAGVEVDVLPAQAED